jgi:hypothetical protein
MGELIWEALRIFKRSFIVTVRDKTVPMLGTFGKMSLYLRKLPRDKCLENYLL